MEQFGVVGGGREDARLRPAVVLGVWPDGSDGTDINSLCRSHNERVVAVADDFCKVHLFQYPCARAKVRLLGAAKDGWSGSPGSTTTATQPFFWPRRRAACMGATGAT